MLRNLLLGTSALGLAAFVAASAQAQVVIVPDASIEGAIQSVTPGAGVFAPFGATKGEMVVMGVTVRVLASAPIHSDTNPAIDLSTLENSLPGREHGFLGGTAIVTGDSSGGVLYASDVFVEVAENVVVGEATGTKNDPLDDLVTRSTINNVIIVPLEDPRTPAGPPINSFGFEIDPVTIPPGSAFSVAGYFAGDRIYYHTLEADAGTLINATTPQVSILRAQCRARNDGRSRDELEVRGGTYLPAAGRVTIQTLRPGANPSLDASWISRAPINIAPVVDPVFGQGLYRYTASNLNFGAVCPAQVRAIMRAAAGSPILASTAGFGPDSR